MFLTLTWDAMSGNGERQAWWPKCVQPPFPPGKFEAQLKSAFGDSCYYFKLYLNLVDQLICMVLMFLKLSEQTDATTPNNMQQGVQTDIWQCSVFSQILAQQLRDRS